MKVSHNEYGIIAGAGYFKKLDEEAHKFAKRQAELNGFDINNIVVVTKSCNNLRFFTPTENFYRTTVSVSNKRYFKKNEIVLSAVMTKKLKDNKTIVVLASCDFVFKIKELNKFKETIK